MAEGDTVHRTAARLANALGREPLVAAEAPSQRSPLRRQRVRLDSLVGRRLERAHAHGKHLFLRFEGDLTLHCHQGMRGTWRFWGRTEPRRPDRRSAWVVLGARAVEAAQFGGPTLALLTDSETRGDPRLRSLGVDILDDDFDVELGLAALRERAEPESELGVALLDQRVIAGIGNVYKAEGCFAARVSPWRRVTELSDEDLRRVVLETASLMRAGLETGRQPHDVYRRGGRPCPRCGEPINVRGQGDANRTAYWCSRCQM